LRSAPQPFTIVSSCVQVVLSAHPDSLEPALGKHPPLPKSTSKTAPKVLRAGGSASQNGTTLSNQAYEQLRDLIVRGGLAPGMRIIESDLAERLGTSRTPVRSALHQLEKEGWVLSTNEKRNSRLTIPPLTRQDAVELYSIIGELEALAARWAAVLPAPKRVKLAHRLREINEELLRLSKADTLDVEAIYQTHTEFHLCFVGSLDAPRLQVLHHSIKPQAERYRRIYSTGSPENIHASHAEHAVIIHSIELGAATAAEAAVRKNWENSAERLSRLINHVGERGSW
jgi:DNA-binding GntR family transcriptional regulator